MHYPSHVRFLAAILGLGLSLTPVWADTPNTSGSVKTQNNLPATQANQDKSAVHLEKELATVNFSKGSSDLVEAERSSLEAMISKLKPEKAVEKIIVVAWGDRSLPSAQGETLPKAEQDLARQRAKVLEKFLEDRGITHVDTHSMAEQASWIAKTFRLDDAQIKGKAADSKIDSLNEERIVSILNARGGPSKAVIIIKRQDDKHMF